MNHEPEVTQTDVMLTKQVKERIESSEIARLQSQITKLRKALEPFGGGGEMIDKFDRKLNSSTPDTHRIWGRLHVGHLRAAALALEETKE